MISCAESTRDRLSLPLDDRIVVLAEQTGQVLVEFADLLIDELQLFQETSSAAGGR
jgi:hypothetical protein